MSNIKDIPFAELVETIQDLSRSDTDDKKRIRGLVNRKYVNYIPREFDWTFLKVLTSLDLVAEYDSGFVLNTTTQDNVVTFSGATITSAMTGRKIKFTNNSNVYDFTFTDGTGGTIAPSLSLATNVSMQTYSIYKSVYSLPADFDRFPINGGLLFYSGGQTTPLPETDDDDYYYDFTASVSANPDRCRLLAYDTAGNREVEIMPPPSAATVLGNEYFKALAKMKMLTDGTVDITSSGTAVTGTGTRFSQMETGDYIRIDSFGVGPDSTWHRLDVITNDTTATISPAFRSDSSATTSEYTISSVPKYPYRLQEAIIPGVMEDLLPDQNDPNYLFYHSQFAQVLSDNKVLILNRKTKDDVELIAEDYNYRR